MSKYHISIIEDDEWFSETIKYYLELNEDNIVDTFTNAEAFFKNAQKVDVVCVDYQLPGMHGDAFVNQMRMKNPKTPIIVVSAQEDMQKTVILLNLGVKDYIIKTEHAKDLVWKAVEEVKEKATLEDKILKLEKKLARHDSQTKVDIIGNSTAIKSIKNLISKAAESTINVSITGETGTGKEVVAKQIHALSDRKNNAFVAVNMGAIPADLVESELFGYEKGAFTGAVKSNKGKFELANGGTLFLDEIAELDLNLQSKILRALQEKEITPLGSEKTKKLDVRLIVASHKDLAEEVQNGNFREDLFYRIIGLPILLPALRDREGDSLLLSEYFLNEFTKENLRNDIKLSKEAKEKLLNYPFPGNIRELKSVIELAAIMAENDIIQAEDIRFNTVIKKGNFYADSQTLKEHTEKIILHYLEANNNNVLKTAAQLDIGKSTIYNLLNKINEGGHV